jgi:hypothetical protein
MKKIRLIVLLSFTGCFQLQAQTDAALLKRLDEILRYTQVMDMEKVMDYTWPKLFTIAPREQLMEVVSSSFDNETFSTSLDSLQVDTIFPSFSVLDESFSKIRHSMTMRMKFKDPVDSAADIKEREMMAGLMEGQFGKGNVRYDHKTDALIVMMHPDLVAVKNKEEVIWYFVNLDEENEMMMNLLFSKEVQDKLKEYQ